jgi:hypothetical protein
MAVQIKHPTPYQRQRLADQQWVFQPSRPHPRGEVGMYVRARPPRALGLGYPWINAAIEVPVRHFECRPGARGVLDSFLPQPLPVAERIDMLRKDAGGAAYLAKMVAGALDGPTAAAVAVFQQAFGPAPTVVLKGGKEPIGRIVRRRFEGTFKLLASGALLYSCGLPVKGGGPEQNGLDYGFKVRSGEFWIALGLHFWIELFSDDRFAMLLMAALRVGYGKWVTESTLSANTANAFCYAKFAFRALGAEPPPFVEVKCAAFV